MYRLQTLLHIAVAQCNIEMVKILLIHGADTSLRRMDTVNTWSRDGLPQFIQMEYIYSDDADDQDDSPPEEMSSIHFKLQSFVDQDFKSGDIHESVDVFTILERAECEDQNVKKEIAALLSSEKGHWFPELLDFYPGDQGEALRFMLKEWNTPLPLEVIEEIAQCYYSGPDLPQITEGVADLKKMMHNIWENHINIWCNM